MGDALPMTCQPIDFDLVLPDLPDQIIAAFLSLVDFPDCLKTATLSGLCCLIAAQSGRGAGISEAHPEPSQKANGVR